MHTYSCPESRVLTYALIGVVAIVVAWAIFPLTSLISWPEWLVGAPSALGVYALLYAFYDRILWRTRAARSLGLSWVTDVAGRYEGELVSSYKVNDLNVRRPITIDIRQTWTSIEVAMLVATGSSTSRSRSAMASIVEEGMATQLTYVYRNKVNPAVADDDMGDHDGAAELLIRPDGSLTGRYFNMRPRAGTIEAKRVRK